MAKPLARDAVAAALPFAERCTPPQEHGDTWMLLVPDTGSPGDRVKVSYLPEVRLLSKSLGATG